MSKKVAIVGMADTTREDAPWDDPEYDIWVLNEMGNTLNPKYAFVERFDALMQIHEEWDFSRPNNHNDPQHLAWLKNEPYTEEDIEQIEGWWEDEEDPPELPEPGDKRRSEDFPIYMQEAFDYIPGAVEYPLDEIVDELLGPYLRRGDDPNLFFTCSLAYLIALATHQEYDLVELYGFEMSSETELRYQREGTVLWMGIAGGRGTQVWVPEKCQITMGSLYGYETGRLIPREAFVERLQEVEEAKKEIQPNLEMFVDRLQHVRQQQAEAKKRIMKKRHAEEAGSLVGKVQDVQGQLNQLNGIAAVNEHWIKECDQLSDSGIEEQIRRQHVEIHLKAIKKELEKTLGKVNQAGGELKSLKREMADKPKTDKTGRRAVEKKLNNAAKKRNELIQKAKYLKGMEIEDQRWIAYADQRLNTSRSED